jgi:hypothetical protein
MPSAASVDDPGSCAPRQAGRYNQCANSSKQTQGNPNKSKEISLHFLWFYLVESGLFKGLQRIQVKKSLSRPRSALRLQKSGAARRSPAPQRSQGIHADQVRHQGMIIAAVLALRKRMSANSRIPQPGFERQ